MKKIILLSLFSLPLSAAELSVTISGIEQQSGTLFIAAFNSAEAMQSGQQYIGLSRSVDADSYQFAEKNLQPGQYAFRVYHDVNGDGKLNTNLMGIPTEPYGFSRNPATMGPPSFEQSAVTVDDSDQAIEINLQ